MLGKLVGTWCSVDLSFVLYALILQYYVRTECVFRLSPSQRLTMELVILDNWSFFVRFTVSVAPNINKSENPRHGCCSL